MNKVFIKTSDNNTHICPLDVIISCKTIQNFIEDMSYFEECPIMPIPFTSRVWQEIIALHHNPSAYCENLVRFSLSDLNCLMMALDYLHNEHLLEETLAKQIATLIWQNRQNDISDLLSNVDILRG